MNKKEFSKKLIILACGLNVFVIIFTIIMVCKTNDTTALIYLIPSVAAEMATATGFYYWKSKQENTKKIAYQFMKDFADKYGAEIAVELIREIKEV